MVFLHKRQYLKGQHYLHTWYYANQFAIWHKTTFGSERYFMSETITGYFGGKQWTEKLIHLNQTFIWHETKTTADNQSADFILQ